MALYKSEPEYPRYDTAGTTRTPLGFFFRFLFVSAGITSLLFTSCIRLPPLRDFVLLTTKPELFSSFFFFREALARPPIVMGGGDAADVNCSTTTFSSPLWLFDDDWWWCTGVLNALCRSEKFSSSSPLPPLPSPLLTLSNCGTIGKVSPLLEAKPEAFLHSIVPFWCSLIDLARACVLNTRHAKSFTTKKKCGKARSMKIYLFLFAFGVLVLKYTQRRKKRAHETINERIEFLTSRTKN